MTWIRGSVFRSRPVVFLTIRIVRVELKILKLDFDKPSWLSVGLWWSLTMTDCWRYCPRRTGTRLIVGDVVWKELCRRKELITYIVPWLKLVDWQFRIMNCINEFPSFFGHCSSRYPSTWFRHTRRGTFYLNRNNNKTYEVWCYWWCMLHVAIGSVSNVFPKKL